MLVRSVGMSNPSLFYFILFYFILSRGYSTVSMLELTHFEVDISWSTDTHDVTYWGMHQTLQHHAHQMNCTIYLVNFVFLLYLHILKVFALFLVFIYFSTPVSTLRLETDFILLALLV